MESILHVVYSNISISNKYIYVFELDVYVICIYMLKVSLNSFLTNQAIIYIRFWSEFRSTEKNLETAELARFCPFCGCFRDIFVIRRCCGLNVHVEILCQTCLSSRALSVFRHIKYICIAFNLSR